MIKLFSQIKVREEQFGLLFFDREKEKYFLADEVGKDVLAAIQSTSTIDEAVDQLKLKYEASGEVIKQDVLFYMDELTKAGLMG